MSQPTIGLRFMRLCMLKALYGKRNEAPLSIYEVYQFKRRKKVNSITKMYFKIHKMQFSKKIKSETRTTNITSERIVPQTARPHQSFDYLSVNKIQLI